MPGRRRTGVVFLALGLLLPLLAAGGARALAADQEPGFSDPISYDIAVRIEPATSQLEVTCEIRFPPDPRVTTLDLLLNSACTILAVTWGGERASWVSAGSASWQRIYRVTPSGSSLPPVISVRYRGSPADYDQAQNRYWSRVTPGAVWLTWTGIWLPTLPVSDIDWHSSFKLAVTVPPEWKVFSPARAAGVKPSADGWQTFSFASGPLSLTDVTAVPATAFFAGPYELAGSGTAGGLPYEVWSLPPWRDEALRTAKEMPGVLEQLRTILGTLLPYPLHIVQLPPDHGGGVAWCQGLAGVAAMRGRDFGDLLPAQLLAHEIVHNVATFYDEGLTTFLADYYVAREYPEALQPALTTRQGYVLEAIRKYGDFSFKEALERRWAGNDVPEWHAYLYSKPALLWNTFRGYLGEEATLRFLRDLQRTSLTTPVDTPESLLAYWRGLVFAAAGPPGTAFFDRFFTTDYQLDLGLEDVDVRRPSPRRGEPDWTLSFTIVDVHEPIEPNASDVIPWVEVAIVTEGGSEAAEGRTAAVVRRIPLTGHNTKVMLRLPSRPLEVSLDPNRWLLDYDSSNDRAEVSLPMTNAQLLLAFSPVLGLVIIWEVTRAIQRRIPKVMAGPPAAGKAR